MSQTTNRISAFNAYASEIRERLDAIRQSLINLDLADDINWAQIGDLNRVLPQLDEVSRILTETSR